MNISLEQWLEDLEQEDSSRTALDRRFWSQESELRDQLRPLPAHVGLWLDRCLIEPGGKEDGDKPGQQTLFDLAVKALELRDSSPAVTTYQTIFERHRREVKAPPPQLHRIHLELVARSRVAMHPASNATVTEGSILLHHTYGVPYLPGSALKGLCRRRARQLKSDTREIKDGESSRWWEQLLGWGKNDLEDTDQPPVLSPSDEDSQGTGGLISFWDALWVPEPPPGKAQSAFSPLQVDVVTPHHSKYYTGGHEAPEEEAPIPSLQLTIAPGTRFLLVLEAAGLPGMDRWLQFILDDVLLPGLAEEGIGARTSSGFGRFEPMLPRAGTGAKGRSSPSGFPAADALTTEVAMVTYQRGDQSLKATLKEGRPAETRGLDGRRILETLSPTVRSQLERGKAQRLRVTWKAVGNGKLLVALQEG